MSSLTAQQLHPLFIIRIKKEERDESFRNHHLDCSFVPEMCAGKNHVFSHGKWSMKWTKSHKRWCNQRASITCEMQSTPICENKATRARGRRRRNDAFSSPSALFQGYYKSNGWIYGVLMCHGSVNHVFFPNFLCAVWWSRLANIFIKLKELVHLEESIKIQVAGSQLSVEYENALNAKKYDISARYLEFYLPNAISTFRKLLILMLSLKRKMPQWRSLDSMQTFYTLLKNGWI